MTMAPLVRDAERGAAGVPATARAPGSAWHLVFAPRYPLTELSMGMSNDYEVAVEEGATMVRLGSTLFSRAQGG